jgi:hypothetical protein
VNGHDAAVRRRRRLSVLAVLLAAVVPAAVLLVGLIGGDRERIESYFEVARVGADGTAQVEEVIDYDFGAASARHGIYRVIPGLDPSTATVSSPTAPDDLVVEGGRLRIGDPDVTITGSHRYELAYALDTLVQGDRFAWNVVGGEWDVPVESVEAHVISDRELFDVTCDRGTFGATGGCEAVQLGPRHVVVETGRVPAGHAVTVYAPLGEPVSADVALPVVPPVPSGTGVPLAAPTLLGWVVAAVAGLITGRVLRRAGREEAPPGWIGGGGRVVLPGADLAGAGVTRVDAQDLADAIGPQVAQPRRLTPAQGGVLLAEAVRPQHQAAWLLGQAQQGAVALEGDPKKPTLRWVGGGGAAESFPLLTMFDRRPSIELGTHDSHFERGWKLVGDQLKAWRTSSGLWSPAGERRRWWALGAGIALVVLGSVLAAVLAHRWALGSPSVLQLALLTLPVGVGAGLVVRSWELRVLTPEGAQLYAEVESFRRHLRSAEAADVQAAADAGLLHDHLAWAVALGESDAWRKAVERSGVPAGRGWDPATLLIATSLHASTARTATAPSSSSGGGGGGAGGGGGGGGGGSW